MNVKLNKKRVAILAIVVVAIVVGVVIGKDYGGRQRELDYAGYRSHQENLRCVLSISPNRHPEMSVLL
ncbi:MAG: hypothetical protein QME41_01335 [Actinomycetota bacterium]|nr:hypothetical protein [Actinomycetota bacterium]